MNTSANTNQIHDTTTSTVRATGFGFLRRSMAGALLAAAIHRDRRRSRCDEPSPMTAHRPHFPVPHARANCKTDRGASSAPSAAPCATARYPATAAGAGNAPSGVPPITRRRSAPPAAAARTRRTPTARADTSSISAWSATKPTRCDPTPSCPMNQGIWANRSWYLQKDKGEIQWLTRQRRRAFNTRYWCATSGVPIRPISNLRSRFAPVGTVRVNLGRDHEPQHLRFGSRSDGDRSRCVGLQQFD